MKTLIKPLLIAFAFVLINFSAAQAETTKPIGRPSSAVAYQSGIYTTVEGKVQIGLAKQAGGMVEIRLTNAAGKVLFTQQVGKNQTAARIRLDVSALPDGAYQLEITNGVDSTRHAITLATPQPSEQSRLVALD
ncbi:T9SS type A sorting domain-containing protein [Spirosoma soli]|uniref:T9SS type A sorting domain-containing protein n=1 Tax=Spirosoma soli TaxID=1770529 RepID=A0ABW5M5N6_9BACT